MAAEPIASGLVWVRDELRGGGLSASIEPADVELPGVIVYPSVADFGRLDVDTYELTVDLVLVAAQVRALDALDELDAVLAVVRAKFPGIGPCRAVMVNLAAHSPDPLPGFQTSIVLSVQP